MLTAVAGGGGVLALVVVLVAEVLLARVEPAGGPLEPFSREQLDASVGAGATALRLAWLGDSTGAGVGASEPARALPRVVAAGLGRRVDLSVLAVSGARVADVLADQLPALVALRPDIVVVGIGNNDVTHLTRRGAFRDRLDAVLRSVAATEPSHTVVLGTAAFAGTPLLRQPLRAFAAARSRALDRDIRAVAARYGALYVPIAARTGRAFGTQPRRYHARDGFHPSDEGYALWAAATLAVLRPALSAVAADT